MHSYPQRQVFNLSAQDFGGLSIIGRYNYTSANQQLLSHTHPGAYEFCYLAKGQQTYEIEGLVHHLESGDILYTRPGETHSSAQTPEQKGILYWFVLTTQRQVGWLNFNQAEQRSIIEQLNQSARRQFKTSQRLQIELDRAITALQNPDGDAFTQVKVKNALSQVLLMIYQAIAEGGTDHYLSPEISHNLEFIAEHLTDGSLSMQRLATQTGLSVSRYKSRFKQETGYPPADYMLRQKIAWAKTILADDTLNITAIALELNFSSSQYFSTVFKRYVGQTPSAFQRSSKSTLA
ncbi:MAG: AraC family transcriptional regulator [Oceanospirillaceae bacterium]|nr:AraC family transcriptional regulator [Oceanospirillaceae bacterium]